MKKHHLKSKFHKRNRHLSSLILAILFFQIGALVSPILGLGFAICSLALPFVWKESGILATGGAGGVETEEEKAAKILIEKVKDHFNKAGFMTADEFQKKYDLLITEFANKNGLDKLPDVLKDIKEMSEKIQSISEKAEQPKSTSFKDAIFAGMTANKEAIAKLKDQGNGTVSFQVKAAGTITTSNVDPVSSGISILLTQMENGITGLPRQQPFFMNLFSWTKTNKPNIAYAEMKNPDGGAGMTAEGAAKTQADFDLVEATQAVKKVTSFIKVSKEALDDIDQMNAEINKELLTLVKLKADSGCLDGDGTGDNLTGILTVATAFDGAGVEVTSANNFDVIVAAITQIVTAEVISGTPAGFMPNVVVMNPVDVTNMRLTKSSTGEYVFPVTVNGATTVIEVPVVSNPWMPAGEFLVMDSTKASAYIRENANIQVGYVNDDFTKNLVTILCEMRLCIFVKSNHTKAFVKGDFASALPLITAEP